MNSPSLKHHASIAMAVAAAAAAALPAAPAAAAPLAAFPAAAPSPALSSADGCAGFTADARADLVKIAVLDAGVLHPRSPRLVDVRLASVRGTADSSAGGRKTGATARYADAKLLGLQVPGLPLGGTTAEQVAPGSRSAGGSTTVKLAALDAGGLATAGGGKAVAEAGWADAYRCGEAGALTRSATMLAGVALLGGSGAGGLVMQAVDKGTGRAGKTQLVRVGSSGSARSTTDLVRLADGRRAATASSAVAFTDLTLFGGTSQEISARVISQPTLRVVADGRRGHVEYRAATLAVTAGGKRVVTLGDRKNSVGLRLFGKVSAAERPALLGVRLSLGKPREVIGKNSARAEVAALRLEVTRGKAQVLDATVGSLSVAAGYFGQEARPVKGDRSDPAPQRTRPGSATPYATLPADSTMSSGGSATSAGGSGTADSEGPGGGGGLALTGRNVEVVGLGGGALVLLGLVAVFVVRRRRTS